MIKVIILAAGKGTRMDSELPKVLVPLSGKPMIEYLVSAIVASGVDSQPVVVVSPDNKDIISQALHVYDLQYAVQAEQLGTGHAVACALPEIAKADGLVVLNGDHPFISPAALRALGDSSGSTITMLTTSVHDFADWRKNFWQWGRIVRADGEIRAIIEFKDADDAAKEIKEVNPAVYRFDAPWFRNNIEKVGNNNAQKEFYLTDMIKLAFESGAKIDSIAIEPREAMGINSKAELEVAEKINSR